MEKGIFTELENLFETMPDINKFGVENWLDLLAIRTKYPNYNALEQSRMDCLAVGYTPFASKFFINSVMNSPVNKRKNANYFRQIISNNAPGLSKFPLVKGNTYLPYSFQTLPSKILGKIKQKAGFTYSDPIIQKFLFSLKEYVLDTINSSEVRKCPVYDYKNLQKLAELY